VELRYKDVQSGGGKSVGEQVMFPKEWISSLGEPKRKEIPEAVMRFAVWAREQGYAYSQIVNAVGIDLSADALAGRVRRWHGK